MALTNYNGSNTPDKTHTISEFISAGSVISNYFSYTDFSLIQRLDKTYYIIKNVLDDYIEEMKNRAILIELSDKEKDTYIYNPKLLSYKLYKTTMLYWVILKLNNQCNVHEFNLSSSKIYLLKPTDMFSILQLIYNSEKYAIANYNSVHENDKSK